MEQNFDRESKPDGLSWLLQLNTSPMLDDTQTEAWATLKISVPPNCPIDWCTGTGPIRSFTEPVHCPTNQLVDTMSPSCLSLMNRSRGVILGKNDTDTETT